MKRSHHRPRRSPLAPLAALLALATLGLGCARSEDAAARDRRGGQAKARGPSGSGGGAARGSASSSGPQQPGGTDAAGTSAIGAAAARKPATPPPKPKPKVYKPRPVTARIVPRDWYRKAYAFTNRRYLARAFKRAGFEVPKGAYLLAARVIRGVKQPAFQYYSLRDTGFAYSEGHFWPASTVKLAAVVGALYTLRKHRLDGDSWVTIDAPLDRHYSGPVHKLIDRSLRLSTNPDYNRLMYIAGFKTINDVILSPRFGAPFAVMQRRYGGKRTPGVNLRTSPAITWRHRRRRGVIPAREKVDTPYPECPREGNCTSLFELQEVLRRVTLHYELPRSQRFFPITKKDHERIMKALTLSHKKLVPGPTEVFGNPAIIYNKAGRYPGDDHLDCALVIDSVKKKKRRFLLALSVPYASKYQPGKVTHKQLIDIGRATLKALLRRGVGGPSLQPDAGNPIKIALKHAPPAGAPKKLRFDITIRAPGRWPRAIDAWVLSIGKDREGNRIVRRRRLRRRRLSRAERRARYRARREARRKARAEKRERRRKLRQMSRRQRRAFYLKLRRERRARWRARRRRGATLRARFTFRRRGEHLIVVHARRRYWRLGYRAATVMVDDGKGPPPEAPHLAPPAIPTSQPSTPQTAPKPLARPER